jgi:hypothetical protein
MWPFLLGFRSSSASYGGDRNSTIGQTKSLCNPVICHAKFEFATLNVTPSDGDERLNRND